MTDSTQRCLTCSAPENLTMHARSKLTTRGTMCLAAVAAALLAGCQPSIFDDAYYPEIQTPPDRFQDIEAVTLTDQSRTEPITVDEAAESALDRMLDRPARESIDLTLEEVRALALQNNLDLRVELINPSISAASLDAEEAKFESVFTGSVRRSVFDAPTSVSTAGTQTDVDSAELGVRVPLRTGGTVNVGLPVSKTSTNNPFSLLNPAYDVDLRFSISQPLLRNAGQRVNTHSIRVADYQGQITNARTRLESMRILANADKAYWEVYAARRELEVRQQQYELAVEQLQRARRRVAAEAVPEVEELRAASGVASRLEAIIVAETTLKRRERDLKRILNRPDLPINSVTAVRTSTDPDPVSLDLDGDALANFAIDSRMEMLEEELRLAIATSNLDLERNARLPLITLDYSYTVNGLDSSFGGAMDQIPDHSFEDWSLGVNAEIPIGNEQAKARVHRAILERLQRLAQKEQRELAIRQEVHDALDQLEQAWQRILAARQSVILQTRTYEAEQRQFDVGRRTSTDVLDAAANLADAQSQEIRALTDYQVAQIDIAFATGTLLGHGKVRWEPIDVDDID